MNGGLGPLAIRVAAGCCTASDLYLEPNLTLVCVLIVQVRHPEFVIAACLCTLVTGYAQSPSADHHDSCSCHHNSYYQDGKQ